MRMRAIASLALALCPASLSAQDTSTAKWGQVGGWSIRVDRSVGNGCFASQLYEDGTSLRVGFDKSKQTIYFMIGNAAWRSLEVGKVYRMRFVFDGEKSYNGELTGLKLGSVVFLDHSDVSIDFTKDFMQRNGVRVYYQGNQITHLSLSNTYAAIAEVLNCQREINNAGGQGGPQPAPSGDPFSSGKRDPFSR